MKFCTIFKKFSVPIDVKSLDEIANWISSGKFEREINEIRMLLKQGRTDEAQSKKKQLLAFTPSATFKNKRLASHIVEYSGLVHLDFDGLSEKQMQSAFKIIIQIPYTFLCFFSPSGNGLKVFVEVNTGADQHDMAYTQVMQYYERATGLKADEKCKDITRLCFMSHHPELYKNACNQKFEMNTPILAAQLQNAIKVTPEENKDYDYTEILQSCVRFTEQKKPYSEGSRNDFIYLLASNCNRRGIPAELALQFAQANYDLPHKEIAASFRSAYTHNMGEFAKFAKTARMSEVEQLDSVEDFLKDTPSIPVELYSQMPLLIQSGATVFADFRERDVFFTGALAILSGCLPGVKGLYAGQEVFPNLFSFVVAPAASGKGALKFARMLADEYHSFVLRASREAETLYNLEVAEHKQRLHTKKKGEATTVEPPAKPTFKVVYIPANTSYAKILWHLEQNGGTGIICETEADTLGNVFKQEWGSYSDMLRKSFHHERISSSRKTNNEFTEVDAPSLSIALSGTPNQVTGLIASAEDGLFSRFLFYAYRVEQRWKDVSPYANNFNLTDHFKQLSKEVFQMVQFLQKEETFIDLTPGQWQQLNNQGKTWLYDITMFTAEEAASIVKRLGLIVYRMAMLFTALRKFENAEAANQILCTDQDFDTCLKIAEIYLHHSILMFNNLPKQAGNTQFKIGDSKRKFIDALPKEFTTKKAIEIGKRFHLSYSTVTHLLPKLVPSHFSRPKAGYYCKN